MRKTRGEPFERVPVALVGSAEHQFERVIKAKKAVWDPTDLSPFASRATSSTAKTVHLAQAVERMVEALNPEAGIDAEYHPRRDVGYCFKGLRVAAKEVRGKQKCEKN